MAHFFMTWRAQPLPSYALPVGYGLRTYVPGDEDSWLQCCKGGELGTEAWEAGQFERDILNRQGIEPQSIFFAVDPQGRIAATATAVCEVEYGYVHMVAVDEASRGKTLGKAVCLAVMRYLVSKGYDTVRLETDDFRVPAIKIYEWLGFVREEESLPNG